MLGRLCCVNMNLVAYLSVSQDFKKSFLETMKVLVCERWGCSVELRLNFAEVRYILDTPNF